MNPIPIASSQNVGHLPRNPHIANSTSVTVVLSSAQAIAKQKFMEMHHLKLNMEQMERFMTDARIYSPLLKEAKNKIEELEKINKIAREDLKNANEDMERLTKQLEEKKLVAQEIFTKHRSIPDNREHYEQKKVLYNALTKLRGEIDALEGQISKLEIKIKLINANEQPRKQAIKQYQAQKFSAIGGFVSLLSTFDILFLIQGAYFFKPLPQIHPSAISNINPQLFAHDEVLQSNDPYLNQIIIKKDSTHSLLITFSDNGGTYYQLLCGPSESLSISLYEEETVDFVFAIRTKRITLFIKNALLELGQQVVSDTVDLIAAYMTESGLLSVRCSTCQHNAIHKKIMPISSQVLMEMDRKKASSTATLVEIN